MTKQAIKTVPIDSSSVPGLKAPIYEGSELAAKRIRIIERAAHWFVKCGYDGTTLDDIAIAAGVSKVSLYRLFGDKAQLFDAVVVDTVARMSAPLRHLLEHDGPMEEVLIHYVEQYGLRMIAPIAGRYPFFEMARVLIGNAREHPKTAATCFDIFRRDLVEPLRKFFHREIKKGSIVAEDPVFLASSFAQLLFFTNYVLLFPQGAPDPDEIAQFARQKVRLFLRGCRP